MASTAPIHLPTAPVAVPPYRRATAARHRRTIASWQAERTIRFVKAWLAQPVRATRAQHATVAGLYAGVAVSVSVFLAAVVR